MTRSAPGPARNPPLLVLAGTLKATLFPIPVMTIFWQDQIGMSLADVMLLQAIFGATIVLLEFPSGYLGDRLGYRLSLIAGALFWTAGWCVYVLGTTFSAMVFAEIVLGIGLAFISGADSALMYASLKATDRAAEYARWEGRSRAAAQLGEAASAGVGGWFYSLAPRLPFWLQVPVALGALGAVASTREAGSRPRGERVRHAARAWGIVRHALLHHRRLRSAMLLSVILGVSTYLAVWLIQPWMRDRGIPIVWFGPLWAAAHLWLACVSLLSARAGERFGIRGVLAGCVVLAGLSYWGLASSFAPAGVVWYLGFMTVRGLQGPLLAVVLQADAPAEDRASVLSLNALLFRLGAAVALPPIGAIADRWGLEAALEVSAVTILAAGLASWRLFARAHDSS